MKHLFTIVLILTSVSAYALKIADSLYISPSDNVVNLVMPTADYDSWITNDDFQKTDKPSLITKKLYRYFKDDFDMIMLITNEKERPQTLSYYGVNRPVANSVEGIGLNIYNYASGYGSDGKLFSLMYLPYLDAIKYGPTLHEFCHCWANFAIPTLVGGHWGICGGNTKGQLGGFKQSTLMTNVDGIANKYSVEAFGVNANGGNSVPYNEMELYLMGMLPIESVQEFDAFPEIEVETFDYYDESNTRVCFISDSRVHYTQASLIELLGERVPDYTASQKEFKAMFVVLSREPLTSEEWEKYESGIEWFCQTSDDGSDWLYNFWEATRGVGSINPSDLSQSLISGAPQQLYTVTFVDADGVTVIGSPQTVEYGGAATAPEVEIPQCRTLSWDKDFSYITSDLTIQAIWSETSVPEYTVTTSDEAQGTVTVTHEPASCVDLALSFRADAMSGWQFVRWSDGNTDNPRTLTLTSDTTVTAVFEQKVLSSDIVLQENEDGEYYTQFAQDYNGRTVTTATLNRQFKQGRWSTLCLPFDVSKGMMQSLGLNSRVYELRYAEIQESSTLVVYFSAAQTIEAGKGYIVNANARLAQKTSFVFPNVTIRTDADNEDIASLTGYNDGSGRGGIYLVGTLRTGQFTGTLTSNTYMGLKDNTIYYPNINTGTSIRAYRGFFRSDVPVNVQRIRIVAEGESPAELQITDSESDGRKGSFKFIENGVLYIRSNGRTYNTHGQMIE